MVGVCLPKEQHVAHCVFAVDDLGQGWGVRVEGWGFRGEGLESRVEG